MTTPITQDTSGSEDDMEPPSIKKRKLGGSTISDADISDIIRLLEPDDLRKLFYALKLKTRDIDKAEIKAATTDVDLKARRVLEAWRQRCGHEASHESIIFALEECGNMEAMRTLEDKWKKAGESCSPFDVNGCKQELIRFYKYHMGKIQLLPWCDEFRGMDEIYVSLELEEKRGRRTKLLDRNEDLVTLTTSESAPATRVFVKGVAGSGKSTLLAKLAYKWAQQKDDCPLSNYDLLIVLSLREVDRDDSLIDAIFHQILAQDTAVSGEGLRTFIQTNPNKVIILLDGLDEYVRDVSKETLGNGIDDIIHFKVLRDCRMILSSRPYKQLNLKHQSYYVSVNLTGFSPENVELYMTRFFDGDIELVTSLKARVGESDMLSSLSTIPVILMLMCLLWEDEKKLPDTQSELYQEFALYLWRKYCIKVNKEYDDTTNTDFSTTLCSLGQKAFGGLCPEADITKEKLIFSENDFTQPQFELGCETGLITRERLRSRQNMISSVTFLHKSFQEYCAAQYLANLFVTNHDQFHRILKQIVSWDVLLSKLELLKFCCGVVATAGRVDILNHAIQLFQASGDFSLQKAYVGVPGAELEDDSENHLLPILTLVYECQLTPSLESFQKKEILLPGDQQQTSRERLSIAHIAQAVRSLFSNRELVVRDKPLQTFPMLRSFAISSFGSLSLSTINSLRVIECPVDSLGVVTDTLRCTPDIQGVNIEIGDAKRSCEPDPLIESLGDTLASLHQLRSITVDGISEETISIAPIVQALSASIYCPCYSQITFSYVTFNVTHMVHLLSKTTQLKELDLTGNQMTPSDTIFILEAMQVKVEALTLCQNQVRDAIEHMGHIVSPQLRKLYLGDASLNEDHVVTLSRFLQGAPNLRELILEDNTVGMAIFSLIQHLQNCTRLSVSMAQIPEQGIIELASRFASVPNLSVLDIRQNEVGNRGINTLFQHLHHLKDLKILMIDGKVDQHCSDLVRDCLGAIGRLPEMSETDCVSIRVDTSDHPSEVQTLIQVASKHMTLT